MSRSGVPSSGETLNMPLSEPNVPNVIPSGVQLNRVGEAAAITVRGFPPSTSIRAIALSASEYNAIDRPFGEKTGFTIVSLLSLPGIGMDSKSDMDRRYSREFAA